MIINSPLNHFSTFTYYKFGHPIASDPCDNKSFSLKEYNNWNSVSPQFTYKEYNNFVKEYNRRILKYDIIEKLKQPI